MSDSDPLDGGKWVLFWVLAMLFAYAVLAFGVAIAIRFT